MLDSAKVLKGYSLHSRDGDFGRVKDFFFDDHYWTIRYLVADTAGWLLGRTVLISPYALGSVNRDRDQVTVDLTMKQIEDGPSATTDRPVSRHFEESYYSHFGWPMYWGGPYMWGEYPRVARDRQRFGTAVTGENAWDPHLRSTHDVDGHRVEAIDGEIGHVEDFIIDDDTWAIRYIVVDTRNWWPGKRVLVSPKWIKSINWLESKVVIDLPRATIKAAPEYSEGLLVNRDYETQLHRHYERPGYWVDELAEAGVK